MNISIFIEFSFWSNEHYNYCCLLQFIKLYSTFKCVMEIFAEFHFVNITYIYFYWIHFLANWIYNYSKLFYCLWQLINFYFLLSFTIKSLWMSLLNFIYEYIYWTLLFWSIRHIIIPNYFVDFWSSLSNLIMNIFIGLLWIYMNIYNELYFIQCSWQFMSFYCHWQNHIPFIISLCYMYCMICWNLWVMLRCGAA